MNTQNATCTPTSKMERIIRRLAGTVVMLSVGLGYFVSPYWFLLTAFAGLNLFQSSFTNFCLPEILLRKFNLVKEG